MKTAIVGALCGTVLLQATAVAQTGWTWIQVATTGPGPRDRHTMAYDSQRSRTVLFGGLDSGGAIRGDTWEWDGRTWRPQLFASRPPARIDSAMAYDSQRARTVLFGGSYSSATGSVKLGDTWEWFSPGTY